MNELLGNRIKELRSAKNFTQEQMADQIGVSRQKYARIEKGTNQITLEMLSRIARVLDVTVADITRVLDETPMVAYRAGTETAFISNSSQSVFLVVFFTLKHNPYNKTLSICRGKKHMADVDASFRITCHSSAPLHPEGFCQYNPG